MRLHIFILENMGSVLLQWVNISNLQTTQSEVEQHDNLRHSSSSSQSDNYGSDGEVEMFVKTSAYAQIMETSVA